MSEAGMVLVKIDNHLYSFYMPMPNRLRRWILKLLTNIEFVDVDVEKEEIEEGEQIIDMTEFGLDYDLIAYAEKKGDKLDT